MVNIIFNTEPDWPEAKLLVFPDGPGWIERELGKVVAEKALSIIEDLMPEDIDKIANDIAEKGTETALSVWKTVLKKKEEDALGRFYLVPISKVLEFRNGKDQLVFKEDRIILRLDRGQVDGDACSDPDSAVADTEVAFYRNRKTGVQEEGKIIWPISLNLPVCYHRLKVRDSKGVRGVVDDIELNYKGGIITRLIVRTIGETAGEHLVDIGDFDFATMTSKKPFGT